MKYRCEYRYNKPFGSPKHNWTVIGRHGAIHFHVTEYKENVEIGIPRFSAGLETHYRSPPERMEDEAPHHDRCWLLQCPCWHDGTTLYAEEHLLPLWQSAPHGHERMFQYLISEYENRFLAKPGD